MRIEVSKFVVVITVLTGLIATILGLWGWFSPETHPQFMEGASKIVLSWSARELGQGLACFLAVLLIKDARGYSVALFSCWIRETLDFIDFFRIEDTPMRLYFVVGTSVILHSIALYMSIKAVQDAKIQSNS